MILVDATVNHQNRSGLLGLEALLGLVDDEDAALAAHQLVIAMAGTKRLQRVADFHDSLLRSVAHHGTDKVFGFPVVSIMAPAKSTRVFEKAKR